MPHSQWEEWNVLGHRETTEGVDLAQQDLAVLLFEYQEFLRWHKYICSLEEQHNRLIAVFHVIIIQAEIQSED